MGLVTEKETAFNFKARYYRLGQIDASTTHVWFVLHGYGQLARYFIGKFSGLARENPICVIAPEGLSRFYLDDLQASGRRSDRVGATWMTRENRETDIANYIQYLNGVYFREMESRSIPVSVLGFSQGSATACRWAMDGQIRFDRLILWAGIFPPDMNFETGSRLLANKKVFFVHGTEDPFLTGAKLDEMKAITERLNASVTTVTFEGKHDIHEDTLRSLSDAF